MTFIDQIREQCARKGSEPALVLGKRGPDAVSYAQLGQGIDNVCADRKSTRLNSSH